MQVFPSFMTQIIGEDASLQIKRSSQGFGTVFRSLASIINEDTILRQKPSSQGLDAVFRSLTTVINNDSVVPGTLHAAFMPHGATERKNMLFSSLPASADTLGALREKLEEAGISEETLDTVLQQAAGSGGISWNQLFQKLQQDLATNAQAEPATFAPHTRNALQSLLQKLGFTNEEVTTLTEQTERGHLYGAWQALSGKINSLPETAQISIDRQELRSLAKAMRLPAQAENRLISVMQDAKSMTMSPAALQHALAEIGSAVSEIQTALDGRLDQLRDIIRPAMNKALEANTKTAQADNRQTRDTANSLLLMRDSSRSRITSTLYDEPYATEEAPPQVQKRGIPPQASQDTIAGTRTPLSGDQDAKTSGEQGKPGQEKHGQTRQESFKESLGTADAVTDKHHSAAEKIIKHAEIRHTEQPIISASMQQRMSAQEFHHQQVADKTQSTRVFEQVEKGLLENLRNGQRRLTLRLDPPELGKVAVTLSVINKEITAIIRPESPEAVKAVNDQLHQLRLSLEQQGLKVERLEVQQQLQDSSSSPSWQGAEQHNQARQKQQWLQREQRMAAIRREGDSLAQEMQVPEHKARITTSAVDIIA